MSLSKEEVEELGKGRVGEEFSNELDILIEKGILKPISKKSSFQSMDDLLEEEEGNLERYLKYKLEEN